METRPPLDPRFLMFSRLLISRTALFEVSLTRSATGLHALPAGHALRLLRGLADAQLVRKLATFLALPEVDGERELWARVERELASGRMVLEQRLLAPPRLQADIRLEPPAPPEPAPPLEPMLDDDRALFLVRHDPRIEPEQILHFDYLIRDLEGQSVVLRILADAYPGQVVHERLLGPDETRSGVHRSTWDVIATQGPRAGRRFPAFLGPCTIALVHDDDRLNAEASFVLVDAVQRLTLDGFFHTRSALFLPSRSARPSAPIKPFEFVPASDARDTIGVSLLAQVLATCGAPSSDRQLIVVGHASSAGGDELNDELAQARADCVWALLQGDDQAYVRAAEAFGRIEDDYVILRYCARVCAWPCDPGEPRSKPCTRYRKAVRAFQDHYNQEFDGGLAIDGEVGPNTRAGFARVIESALATALGGAPRLAEHRDRVAIHGREPVLGCGERFAARRPGVDDRRVEALAFGPGDPIPPEVDAIYVDNRYRFIELDLALADEVIEASVDTLLEWLSPDPPSRDAGDLDRYTPLDADDPWDFLHAFRGLVNAG